MPRKPARAIRRGHGVAHAEARNRSAQLKLLVTSALAVFLVIELVYFGAQYSSLANANASLQGYVNYLEGGYYNLQNSYASLNASLGHPSILSPPVRFYIGTSPANATGLTQVPKDQVFCPENATIEGRAASLFSYPYYTELEPGEEFNYTLVYNSSITQSALVVVSPPFRLVSYGSGLSAGPMCAGYPNALYAVSASVRAPESNYTGPVTVIIYRE